VGTAHNKNLETLILALKGMNCILSVIGPLTNEQKASLDHNNIEFENYLDLSPASLKDEYEKCDIVAFVSVHEGFGMPIIEAQAVGRPVITSRMASLPEVAGDGAYYIENPLDANEIQKALYRIINDESIRRDLVTAGFLNASKYTHPEMVKNYYSLYHNMA